MTDDSLIAAKAADGFKTESPIRAFTDFQVSGQIAIGKGFRPSMAHLARYLDAMESKEGWRFVQVILAPNDEGDPTIMFHRVPTIKLVMDGAAPPPAKLDDPVNPKHYDGTACAEIGERLSANAYQVLKYCWRLGKKDDPCVELGKALWYLKREFHLLEVLGGKVIPITRGIAAGRATAFLEERIVDQSVFTQEIARLLWDGYTMQGIFPIRTAIETQKNRMECGAGLAL